LRRALRQLDVSVLRGKAGASIIRVAQGKHRHDAVVRAEKLEAEMAKKAAESKPAAADGKEKKVNPALMKPLQPSKELAAIVGSSPLPRPEVVSKLWAYIKKNNLQNPENKREIIGDDKLKAVFGTDKVTMFEMNKHVARHLK
jgi:chromatin remodeling complex protein RSC6